MPHSAFEVIKRQAGGFVSALGGGVSEAAGLMLGLGAAVTDKAWFGETTPARSPTDPIGLSAKEVVMFAVAWAAFAPTR